MKRTRIPPPVTIIGGKRMICRYYFYPPDPRWNELLTDWNNHVKYGSPFPPREKLRKLRIKNYEL